MYELALFAGGGGGILGGKLLGWRCIGAVEKEEYQRALLLQRQNEGLLDPFPIWDDVTTFTEKNRDCKAYFKILHRIRHELVISGGFPCQDISLAGKGEGLNGKNSRLWWEYYRIICEVRPAYAFVENSPELTIRGLNAILGALSEVGYNAIWGVLGASDIGANHRRKRLWLLAYTNEAGLRGQRPGGFLTKAQSGSNHVAYAKSAEREGCAAGACECRARPAKCSENVADNHKKRCKAECQCIKVQGSQNSTGHLDIRAAERRGWWSSEPALGRVVDGMAGRVVQIETLGNGQVPAVAAAVYSLLSSLIPGQ
jgi:DNA (cytosine-5)-methyltransferase 1